MIRNILSLFDGISAGRLALNRAGIKYDNYYASEIDKHAIKIAQKNFPDTIQIGDVKNVKGSELPEIWLLIGGSPCQSFSVSGKMEGFEGESGLFYEYLRILREVKPKYFLLENVKMKKEWRDVITQELGVDYIEIDSAKLSAQHRRRLYWQNFPNVTQPEDAGIFLKDILEEDAEPITYTEARTEEAKQIRREVRQSEGRDFSPRRAKHLVERKDGKSNCITATQSNKEHIVKLRDKSKTVRVGGRGSFDRHEWDSIDNAHTRKFTINEIEALQTFPKDYTLCEGVSESQRWKSLGNSFNVDTIAHILKHLSD
jgi:DNA (cytosine-5)-methyltransferase 3A